jgi:hypothetical protein
MGLKTLNYEYKMPYEDHKFFTKPADLHAKVWRYMDFTKFVLFLENRELWFSRVDKLNDPFEGTLSKMSLYTGGVVPKQSAEYDNFVKIVRDSQLMWRKWDVVNCWHLNEYESAAMWSLYIKSDCGIAIQSTFDKLTRSFDGFSDKSVYVGLVHYRDYNIDKIPSTFPFTAAMYKRMSFEHEKEVRVLIINKEKGVELNKEPMFEGLSVPVDLDILIERVYVAPQVGDWAYKLVKNIVLKYDIDKPVCHSSLDDVPI